MRYLVALGAIAVMLYAFNDGDALAKCEERMSREVCLHTLYP